MKPLIATPAEVAEALQCSIDVVRDLKTSGRLPHVMLTRVLWGVPWTTLERWLDNEADASVIHNELEADGVDIPGLSSGREPAHRKGTV